MMTRPAPMIIAFDLDGTLSDPSAGIHASINHALQHLGHCPAKPGELDHYIGIPLRDIFTCLLDNPSEDLIEQAIELYRERYVRQGFRENVLYPQIPLLLEGLSKLPAHLYVTTLKTPRIAAQVVHYFGLQDYFTQVLGCGSYRCKADLLDEIRGRENSDCLMMVGDRHQDMQAGQQAGFYCVGVLWGFGSRQELLDHGADCLIETPLELLKILRVQYSY